jgi:hypothetical protein
MKRRHCDPAFFGGRSNPLTITQQRIASSLKSAPRNDEQNEIY